MAPFRTARPPHLAASCALAALVAGTACSYFPSHEEVYIPIPLNIGEPVVEGGDTLYVLTGLGYRVTAPRQQVLADVQHDLDGAARQFQQYFDALPDTVRVRYVDSLEVREIRDFEMMRLGGARIENGEIILPARPVGRARSAPNAPPPFRATTAAARSWVAAHARRVQAAAHGSPGSSDSLRVPAWIESAMTDVVITGALPGGMTTLWRQRQELVPLRDLFAMNSLMETSDRGRPGRGAVQRWSMLRLQAASVAAFIADREDPRFLGEVAERLFTGTAIEEALRGAESLPSDLDRFEEQWRAWIRERGER